MKRRIKACVLLLAVVLFSMVGCGKTSGTTQSAAMRIVEPVTDGTAVSTSDVKAGFETQELPSVVTAQIQTRTVTYLSDDGSVVKTESVPVGVQPEPPSMPELANDHIFLHWAYVSDTGDEDLEILPIYQSVTGQTNVFAIPGAYGTGDSVIFLPLRLCGNVQTCGFDLNVEYDPEALRLLSVFDQDGAILCNDETPGLIRLNYVSIDNTGADVDIGVFKFRVLSDSGETPVTITVKSIYAWDENGEMYVPEYQTVDASVYVCR